MQRLTKGRYIARSAQTQQDLKAVQRLRHRCFFGDRSGSDSETTESASDQDRFDAICHHILIEEAKTERLVGCFRVLPLPDGRALDQSYAAQFYDLSRLSEYSGNMMEIGRFCIDPDITDPDILRTAWAAITRCVDEGDTEFLFGCSSFPGTDPAPYGETFGYLYARHQAPSHFRPGAKASETLSFDQTAKDPKDTRNAFRNMPPLLRSYVAMGGWVSDHAVVDHDMGTLHVFTGLEIKAIPAARARLLRRAAV